MPQRRMEYDFDEKKNLDFYRNLGMEGRYAKAVDFFRIRTWALEPGSMRLTAKTLYANVTAYTPSRGRG